MQLRMARDAYLPNAQTTRPICNSLQRYGKYNVKLERDVYTTSSILGDRVHRDKLALFAACKSSNCYYI